MSENSNPRQPNASPKSRRTALDYRAHNTPEFVEGLAQLAAEYPAQFKKHIAQLRGEAPGREA